MNCARFLECVHHLDREDLPESERRPLQRHLDACPECAERLEIERAFERGLRARLSETAAPPGLEDRVRAALRTAVPDPIERPEPWWRSGGLAVAAASALFVVLLSVPGVTGNGSSRSAPLAAFEPLARGAQTVSLEGMVVDVDCDRAGVPPELQPTCDKPEHVNGLKLGEGRYVRFHVEGVDPRPARSRDGLGVVFGRQVRGQRMTVGGTYFPAVETLVVERVVPEQVARF